MNDGDLERNVSIITIIIIVKIMTILFFIRIIIFSFFRLGVLVLLPSSSGKAGERAGMVTVKIMIVK